MGALSCQSTSVATSTIEEVTANRTFDGPCALREVINKTARRNKKSNAALSLIGFER
jgi:hypothetical protein